MTQLEQELSALFEDAASRVTIRPVPVRSPRSVAINRVLAAGVTAALVAAVALIATRLGADSANRGGAITPTATQQLLDAVARTLSQPIRVESTYDSGQGAAQTTVIEVDIDRQELVSYQQDGQPQIVVSGSHGYESISDTERQFSQVPSKAEWVEMPSQSAESMLQSAAGVSVQQLTRALNSGRVRVAETADGTYRLSGSRPSLPGTDVETIHINGDGLLEWVKVNGEIPTGTGGPVMHVNLTARISPLGHPIHISLPDPGTVISQNAFNAAPGQSCSGGPSPASSPSSNGGAYTSEMHCSFSTSVTVGGTKATPKKR